MYALSMNNWVQSVLKMSDNLIIIGDHKPDIDYYNQVIVKVL